VKRKATCSLDRDNRRTKSLETKLNRQRGFPQALTLPTGTLLRTFILVDLQISSCVISINKQWTLQEGRKRVRGGNSVDLRGRLMELLSPAQFNQRTMEMSQERQNILWVIRNTSIHMKIFTCTSLIASWGRMVAEKGGTELRTVRMQATQLVGKMGDTSIRLLRSVRRYVAYSVHAVHDTVRQISSLFQYKGKGIPITGRGDPWGCDTPRLPHFLDSRLTNDGEVVSLTHRPPFTFRKIPDTHFC
jgi:hypothetical protein